MTWLFLSGLFMFMIAFSSHAQHFDPPAVRPPTGLTGHAGIHCVYLEWNSNLETDLAGYHVYRAEGEGIFTRLGEVPATSTGFTDTVPDTTRQWHYRIKGVHDNGSESGFSNTVSLSFSGAASPQVRDGKDTVRVPGYEAVILDHAVRVTFHNGHTIVFDKDRMRLRDWKSGDGTHLLYPETYGNPLDITQMDNWGFPDPQDATAERPAMPPAYNTDYMEPETAGFKGYTVSGDRITFSYAIPLSETDSARVWETYWPVTRTLRDKGSVYSGVARKVELKMPASYDDGYSVCLNDGFGPDASCDQGITHLVKWGNPGLKTIRWSDDTDQSYGGIRNTGRFHPGSNTLQAIPYILTHFPKGHLLLSAQQYYYSTGWALTNYVEMGKDGIWPNFFTDCDESGNRFTVETFEYLWSPGKTIESPQQFMDASFHYRRKLANLYGLTPHHTSVNYGFKYTGLERGADKVLRDEPLEVRLQALRDWGKKHAAMADTMGAEQLGGYHTLWSSAPESVPDSIRLDTSHRINRAIIDMIGYLSEKDVTYAYWIRPEFIRVTHEDIMQTSIDPGYYQYQSCLFPDLRNTMGKNGFPRIREHHETWLRKGRDGSSTAGIKTPYDWVPTSLTVPGGLYDSLIYPNFVMQRSMGFSSMFFDGGPASLQGIDYTGGVARACQPHWWRLISDIYRLGMDAQGEILAGFGGAACLGSRNLEEASRDHFWAFTHCGTKGNRVPPTRWFSGEDRHTSCQLYISSHYDMSTTRDHGFASRFYEHFIEKHGHPHRVYLEGLRRESERWIWDDVYWEYRDGRRVRYPDYELIQSALESGEVGVYLAAPEAGNQYNVIDTIKLSAETHSFDGNIDSVRFYAGDSLLGTGLNDTCEFSWKPPPAGSHEIYAKAYDDNGNSTLSAPLVLHVYGYQSSVQPGGIRQGLTYDYYRGSWNALPDFSTLNSVKKDTTPDFSVLPDDGDDEFACRFSGYIHIAEKGTYRFSTISGKASRLYIGDRLVVDNSMVHQTSQETGIILLEAGFHPLKATILADTGNQSLTVRYEGPATGEQILPDSILFRSVGNPPHIAVARPADGAVYNVGDTVVFKAEVSDPDNDVHQITFLDDGHVLRRYADTGYRFTVDTLAVGVHSIQAGANDLGGETGVSEPVSLHINGAPAVTILSPDPMSEFTVLDTLKVRVSVTDEALQELRFYLNERLTRTLEKEPWWYETTGMARGTYYLKVTALDVNKLETTEKVQFKVVNTPPSVSIIQPDSGSVFAIGSEIEFQAEASDPDDDLYKVAFFEGNQQLGKDANIYHKTVVEGLTPGEHTIVARAYDKEGAESVSRPITIKIGESTQIMASEGAYRLLIYPNPLQGEESLILESSTLFSSQSGCQVKITDITGRTVYQQHRYPSFSRVRIPSQVFPEAGIYMIEISSNESVVTGKLTVE